MLKDFLNLFINFGVKSFIVCLEFLHLCFNFFKIAISEFCILEKLASTALLLFVVTLDPLLLVEDLSDQGHGHRLVS